MTDDKQQDWYSPLNLTRRAEWHSTLQSAYENPEERPAIAEAYGPELAPYLEWEGALGVGLRHPIVWAPIMPPPPEMAHDWLTRAQAAIDKSLGEGNFDTGLVHVAAPHCLQWLMDLDEKGYRERYPEAFRKAVIHAYIMTEFPNLTYDNDDLVGLFRRAGFKPPELTEPVTLYRGAVYNPEDGWPLGLSWTPDVELARWFATRLKLDADHAIVLKAVVPPKYILLDLTDPEVGREPEYLVDSIRMFLDSINPDTIAPATIEAEAEYSPTDEAAYADSAS